jgi:putative endonuclease
MGYTGDTMQEHLRKHNSNNAGFNWKTGDWKIVYTELYHSKEEAYRIERQVKSWKSRIKIGELVSKKI